MDTRIMIKGLNADTCGGMINKESTVMNRSINQDVAGAGLPPITASVLLRRVEEFCVDATRKLHPARRIELGQFLTPTPIATFMASICEAKRKSIRILDAGVGVGSLTAAVVADVCTREHCPLKISVCAYELDEVRIEYLRQTMNLCHQLCAQAGIEFACELKPVDFIQFAASTVCAPLFEEAGQFDLAILNPPYRKINGDSDIRHVLTLLE